MYILLNVRISYGSLTAESSVSSADLIAVLSVLVTILIGWQIFNYFTFEQKMKSEISNMLEGKLKEVENKLLRRSEITSNSAICVSLTQLGLSLYREHKYSDALYILINAITAWKPDMHEESEDADEAYKNAVQCLVYIQKSNPDFDIDKKFIDDIMEVAYESRNSDVISFANWVRNKI